VEDKAQQTFYFNNQVIAPTGTYTYDALYRLISATGRELTSLGMPSHEDFPDNIPCPNRDPNALQNYTQKYEYDEVGNIKQLSSDGSRSHWVRDYIYDQANNRLLRHSGTTNEYYYDDHGNITGMPHLHFLRWDYRDQFYNTSNGTYSSFYSYDAQGNRTRKVIDKDNIIETRFYINGFELYRREVNGAIDYERTTLNISDDEKAFVLIEQKTRESEVVRYQYDNHLGSACLELDHTGRIISYEEYHPFGTTSYRSGRSEIEVSLKRYKYCSKERDEQTGFYYYGMRYYAAWLCRFVSVDPLQFKYPYYTPYQYAGNKPVSFIDLDGREEFPNPYDMLARELKALWNATIGKIGSFFSSKEKQPSEEKKSEKVEIKKEPETQTTNINNNKNIVKTNVAPLTGTYNNAKYVAYENEIRYGGSYAWRNNNPGNIIKGSFSKGQGAIGSDSKFAIFPDRETGFNAIIALLKTDKYIDLSILGAITRYAPPEDNNNPGSYASSIEKKTGLSVDKILNTLTEEEFTQVAKAIEVIEGTKVGKTYTLQTPNAPEWAQQILQNQQNQTKNENP
jgi:RHS repeat-associated protein